MQTGHGGILRHPGGQASRTPAIGHGFGFSFWLIPWQEYGVTTPIQPLEPEGDREPSQYGRSWSQGIFIAAGLSLGFWTPVYLVVEDQWPNTWWYEFAIAFIFTAAFLSLAWLTCTLAEHLEKRRWRGGRTLRTRTPAANPRVRVED
jgi:hypothetical protein